MSTAYTGYSPDQLLAVIAQLESDLAASREREAALAATLVFAHERIERVITSLHLNTASTDYEAHLLQQIVDDVIGTRGQAILAAHDAEVGRENKIDALEEVLSWIHPDGNPACLADRVDRLIAALKAGGVKG